MSRIFVAVVALVAFHSAAFAEAEKYFEERSHDFGSVPNGPMLVHHFRIKNTSNQTLKISSLRVSCGCTYATTPVAEIKPGESSYVTANMDSRRFEGPKSVTVYVQFVSPVYEEVSLVVQADGRRDFTMYPDSLAFGEVRVGSEPKSSVKVTFFGDPNWQITDVKVESEYVQPTAKLIKKDASEVTYEINTTLRKDLPVGKWYTNIWLISNNANVSKIHIPLTVEVNPAVVASPALVTFGEVRVGESKEVNVMVRGEKPFKIKELLGAGEEVVVDQGKDEALPVHVLKIAYKPARSGVLQKSLTVVTDVPVDPKINIPLRGSAVSN